MCWVQVHRTVSLNLSSWLDVLGSLAVLCLSRSKRALPGKPCLGKANKNSLACAGNPLQETKTAEGIVLTYYKEAPMFEESFASSKASRPGAHHGCWARLLMEDDRVVGVEYRSVPPSVDATDHCEEIFRTCVQ